MLGLKLWKYDSTLRNYVHDDGTRSSGPIFIKAWRQVEVIADTSRSWFIGRPRGENEAPPGDWELKNAHKLPKKESFEEHGYLRTWQEVEDMAWVHENAYQIGKTVGNVKDRSKLEAILKIIGETK